MLKINHVRSRYSTIKFIILIFCCIQARLLHGSIFAKVIEGLRELVNEATWECSGNGITLQAMDSSHVALVSLVMRSEGFESYRCDRNMSLGISLVRYNHSLKFQLILKFCSFDSVCLKY